MSRILRGMFKNIFSPPFVFWLPTQMFSRECLLCIYPVSPCDIIIHPLKTQSVFSLIYWGKYLYCMWTMPVCSQNKTKQMCKTLEYYWQSSSVVLSTLLRLQKWEAATESMNTAKFTQHRHTFHSTSSSHVQCSLFLCVGGTISSTECTAHDRFHCQKKI